MIGEEGRRGGGQTDRQTGRCVTGVTRPSRPSARPSAVDTDFFLSLSPHFSHEQGVSE